jgi:TM2 domain-containing membrane protein YozV
MTDRQDYGQPPWDPQGYGQQDPQGQPRQPQYDPRQHQQRVRARHRVQAQPPAQYPPQGYGQVQPYAPPPYQGYAPPQSPYQGYAPPAPPYPAYPGYPPYGQPQYAPQVAPKSTAAGLILGLLWPGVGCMYAGRIGIGILIMAIWLISIPLMFVGIGFVTGFCTWVASAALGYGLAREWNAKHGIVS